MTIIIPVWQPESERERERFVLFSSCPGYDCHLAYRIIIIPPCSLLLFFSFPCSLLLLVSEWASLISRDFGRVWNFYAGAFDSTRSLSLAFLPFFFSLRKIIISNAGNADWSIDSGQWAGGRKNSRFYRYSSDWFTHAKPNNINHVKLVLKFKKPSLLLRLRARFFFLDVADFMEMNFVNA